MHRGSFNSPTSSGRGSSIASPVSTTSDRGCVASSQNVPVVQDDDGWFTPTTPQHTSANARCQGRPSATASRGDGADESVPSSPNDTWQGLQPPEESAQVDGSDRADAATVSTSDEDWQTEATASSATTPQPSLRQEVEIEAVSSTTMSNTGENKQTAEGGSLAPPPINLQPNHSEQHSATNTASATDSSGAATASSIQRIAGQNVRWRRPSTQAQQQTVKNAFATAVTVQAEGGGGTHSKRSSRATGNRANAQQPAVQLLSAKNLRKAQIKISAAIHRAEDPKADDWAEFPTTEMMAATEAIKKRKGDAIMDREYYAVKPLEDALEPPPAMCFHDDERLEVVVVDVRGPNELLVRHADQAENFCNMEQEMKHLYTQGWRGSYSRIAVWCTAENRSYLPGAWWEKEHTRLLELLAREPFVYCVEHNPAAGHMRRVQVQSIREDQDDVVWRPPRQCGPVRWARVCAIDYDEEYEVDAKCLYWLDKRFYEQPACTFRVKVVDCDRSLPIMQKVATFHRPTTTKQEKAKLICAFTEYSCSILASWELQDENYEGFHCRFFVIPAPVKT